MSTPRVSVIVPTYNEAENITETLNRLRVTLRDWSYEIIVVDDNSPDGTWRIARSYRATDANVRVIRRLNDRGLSSAVLAGMAVADGEALAVIDADGQHDESVLGEMLRPVLAGTAEVCVGTRSNERGGSYGKWTRRRQFASWAAAGLARLLLPQAKRTTDPLSGYFVLSRDAYERVAPTINPRGFKILLEFIGRSDDLTVAEVGYQFRPRRHGETKLSGAIALNYLIAVLDLRFGRTVSPVFLMYCLVGFSGVVVSLAGYGIGELVGLPRINLSLTPDLNPIYVSALFGIQLSIISNFFANNYITFYESRYRGWGLFGGFCRFEAVSAVGVLVQLSVFQLLHRNGFPTDTTNPDLAAAINNGIGLSVATLTNFLLNVTLTWNRAGRGKRFTYG